MAFLELAKKRFSVRKYLATPVEKEKLERILEAGRVAPTASNNQPQRIVVVQSPGGLGKLEHGVNPYNAPLALIVCANLAESVRNSYTREDSGAVDAVIVTTHMMLEAADLGLGSIWCGQFDPRAVCAGFSLPEGVQPVCILLVGHTDCAPDSPNRHATTRKPLNETVFYESM